MTARLARAVAAVRAGEVIAVATDTVWGLVCDPDNAAAVARVFAMKRRPDGLELTVLAGRREDVEDLVAWNDTAVQLANAFWPGPLSLVLPVGRRRLAIPRHGHTLSVRVPDHAQLRNLLSATGPLASTSANRHGAPPLTSARSIDEEFGAELAAVVAGGRPGGIASTIIDCSGISARVLRDGPIDSRRLRDIVQA